MDQIRKSYLQLHTAVFLFGFTAILGALIHLSALVVVWWRLFFTCLSIMLLINVFKKIKETSYQLLLQLMGIGLLVAMHWITFFGSIKLSNASITLVCMATTAFFTSFIEPLVMKSSWRGYELLLGLMIVPGMIFVVQGIDTNMVSGVWVGLLSAILAAIFASFNKQVISKSDPMFITFIELGTGWLFICVLLLGMWVTGTTLDFWPKKMDWTYLVILALLCTTLGYVLALKALRYISAFVSMLALNLEPVYGILLAYFILKDGEELTVKFYIGVVIILTSIFLHPWLKRKFSKSIEV